MFNAHANPCTRTASAWFSLSYPPRQPSHLLLPNYAPKVKVHAFLDQDDSDNARKEKGQFFCVVFVDPNVPVLLFLSNLHLHSLHVNSDLPMSPVGSQPVNNEKCLTLFVCMYESHQPLRITSWGVVASCVSKCPCDKHRNTWEELGLVIRQKKIGEVLGYLDNQVAT